MTTGNGVRALILLAVFSATSLLAQEHVFRLDPAKSTVDFTLADVLHTVHGKFQLKSGVIRFDLATGAANGEFVVDATTGNSGSNARDKKMKRDILETDKFPEIVFTLQKLTGALPTNGASQMQMEGIMTLHGKPHPMTLVVPVQVDRTSASALIHFDVPYVAWGLKNPSTLFLRVSDKVNIDVHAVGVLTAKTGDH
jgi:polyisoprenoid-binding protein YceI